MNNTRRHKKQDETDDTVSKGVEDTASKLYEKKSRACKSHQGHHCQV